MDREVIKIKKGLDIRIIGEAEKSSIEEYKSETYAIKPTDFIGVAPIPKMMIEEGKAVKAGDPLFYDKQYPDVLYTAPVSGTLQEIKRGAKRSIKEVIIKADTTVQYKSFQIPDLEAATREQVVSLLKESGLWVSIKQRPFNEIANPGITPKAIFVSSFDSAPLAPNFNFALADKQKELQIGFNILQKLTAGVVHLGLNVEEKDNSLFEGIEGIQKNYFKGPHPAGNVGIQIHHTDPINKGDVVWTLNIQDVANVGSLFMEGQLKSDKVITVAGSAVKNPKYYKAHTGVCIDGLIQDNLLYDNLRYISGNVLTGTKIDDSGYLGFFDNQITVIEEGDKYELFGWLLPSYPRPSISNTFWTGILANMGIKNNYRVNTNTRGEDRAFVVTGQYESVLPMDIYPVQLLKSIMYRDYNQMEGLGIYEVVEEDLALCEFVCTSKTDVQQILREGLDDIKAQG